MPRYYLYAIVAAVLIILGLGAWLLWPSAGPASTAGGPTVSATRPVPIKQIPGVEVNYINTDLKFSFGLPSGLMVQEEGNGTSTAGMTMKVHGNDGLPVLEVVTIPSKTAPAALTEEAIQKVVPGKEILSPTAVDVVAGVTGVAFESTSTLWRGASSELWFAYKGHLYQISAALENAPLLAFIWNSWQWRK